MTMILLRLTSGATGLSSRIGGLAGHDLNTFAPLKACEGLINAVAEYGAKNDLTIHVAKADYWSVKP
ncbi:MAG: hypothetical protein JSW61_02085 [Candidatus Thorarchaeota archaeon]|nr:MAG: hypothetical protein JSW61_02085 [Candidatus Thorarchaeota archaeon]